MNLQSTGSWKEWKNSSMFKMRTLKTIKEARQKSVPNRTKKLAQLQNDLSVLKHTLDRNSWDIYM